jgi:hypothetical protein
MFFKKNILIKAVNLVLFIVISNVLFSQIRIIGVVKNAGDKKSIAGVSVYLSNTSIGSTTNDNGEYTLTNVPNGKFQIVFSCIGYETYTQQINNKISYQEINVELKQKAADLPELLLEPYEAYGWEKWGNLFTDMFIGTTSYAKYCELKNPEALKFRFNKNKNILSAIAFSPLIITNNAMGYEIEYKLEEFEYDFTKKMVVYNGHPFFKDLSLTTPSKTQRWQDRRRSAYYGSLRHFMRSLYSSSVETEGYEIRSLAVVPNLKKIRAKEILKNNNDKILSKADTSYTISGGTIKLITDIKDSTGYYKTILKQPDIIESHSIIKPDSLCYPIDSITKGIYSENLFEVIYSKKEVPSEFKRASLEHRYDKLPISQFEFINHKSVFLNKNGYYYGPYDLKITGYWAWWESISTLLPYDYVPIN